MRVHQLVCSCGTTGPTRPTEAEAEAAGLHVCRTDPNDRSAARMLREARIIAASWIRQHPGVGSQEFDDLVSDAVIGGLEADKSWRPGAGASWLTHVRTRMLGSLLDGVRDRSHYSRHTVTKAREQNHPGGYMAVLNALPQVRQPPVTIPDGAEAYLGDETAQRGFLVAEARLTAERVLEHPTLTDNERTVLRAVFFEEAKLLTIARRLGFTESRACQIKNNALWKLRVRFDEEQDALVA